MAEHRDNDGEASVEPSDAGIERDASSDHDDAGIHAPDAHPEDAEADAIEPDAWEHP
jgi:hypothetical protein